MLGVMWLILDRLLWSARGDEDFFSVARTMPLVAAWLPSLAGLSCHLRGVAQPTFDTQRCDALVDGIQSILCERKATCQHRPRASIPLGGWSRPAQAAQGSAYRFAPACRYQHHKQSVEGSFAAGDDVHDVPGREGCEGEGVSVRHGWRGVD